MRMAFHIVAFLYLVGLHALAAAVPLGHIGQPFYCPKVTIRWELQTNPLPATVRLFKVVPGGMSSNVISKIMRLGDFRPEDRVYFDGAGLCIPKGTLTYRSADDRGGLSITPSQGLVELYVPNLSTELPEDVPDQRRAVELLTNLLTSLEFPTNEFVTKPDNSPRAWFYPGSTTRDSITRPRSMGVEFRRQFDRIPCFQERVYAQFEAHEKLTQFEIYWRTVQPSRPYAVASMDQIATWIKEGRARVQSLVILGPGGRWLHPKDIKTLVIHEIEPRYSPPSYRVSGRLEEKTAAALYPYAILTAQAEFGPEDHETVFLFVPITPEALTPPSHKTESFSIYPSTLFERQRQTGIPAK